MFGKRIEELNAVATRLEAVAARLDRQEALAASLSPGLRDTVIVAANETLTHVLVDVRAAIVAGERNKDALLRAATAPLLHALATVPERQMAEALFAANTTLMSRLIDHLLDAAPMLPAFQQLGEDFRDGARRA